jgi:glycosyltransferase involved in cell wall biosynthesis
VFFRDQCLALAEHGHRVGVVAVNMRSVRTLGRAATHMAGPAYEVDEGIRTYRRQIWAALPRIPCANYRLWLRAARNLLAQYIREQGRPDVIHAHSAIYAGAVAVEWGDRHGIPVVLTEHSSGFARKMYRRWQLALAEGAAVGAEACIAVSPALGAVLDEQLPRSQGRWIWVPNVVADRFGIDEAADDEEARPKRFLNLAIMTEKKGQVDLLEAFARAFGGGSQTTELWMGGDGPLRSTLEGRAQELGIGHRVRFLGQVPPAEVPALLGRVDAMVIASHYETFGVVAAEALMAGVPVVATRCGGPECIVGKGDGYLVPPRDPEALAGAMVEVAESANGVERRGIAKRAKARFSGEVVARQLTEIYDSILARHRNAGVSA